MPNYSLTAGVHTAPPARRAAYRARKPSADSGHNNQQCGNDDPGSSHSGRSCRVASADWQDVYDGADPPCHRTERSGISPSYERKRFGDNLGCSLKQRPI